MFLEQARVAERVGDFLAARVCYMKYVEDLKMSGAPDTSIEAANKEYEAFVERDPIFEKLISGLLPIIKATPGILQSDITKQAESVDWAGLYSYTRPMAKEDIYYALYFAEKQGRISRTKRGRSYELRVNANP